MDKAKLKNRGVIAAATIYDTPSIKHGKEEAALKIFTERPYLRDVLLDCFVQKWGELFEVCITLKKAL